jgi:hypothetical protein
MSRLVEKQLDKLKKMQQKVDKKYPLEEPTSVENTNKINPKKKE